MPILFGYDVAFTHSQNQTTAHDFGWIIPAHHAMAQGFWKIKCSKKATKSEIALAMLVSFFDLNWIDHGI